MWRFGKKFLFFPFKQTSEIYTWRNTEKVLSYLNGPMVSVGSRLDWCLSEQLALISTFIVKVPWDVRTGWAERIIPLSPPRLIPAPLRKQDWSALSGPVRQFRCHQLAVSTDRGLPSGIPALRNLHSRIGKENSLERVTLFTFKIESSCGVPIQILHFDTIDAAKYSCMPQEYSQMRDSRGVYVMKACKIPQV